MPKKLQNLIDKELFSRAEEVLGNRKKVEKWFNSRLPALNYRTPYEPYKIGKEDLVYNLLGRIEYAVYS